MSHVVSSAVVITDLECLKVALKKFPQLRWREGQTNHAWYGSWQDDYSQQDAAYKNGIPPKDYGKCEHAIHMDGVDYEIGVVKRRDGEGYSLVWDFFGSGKKISKCIGDSAEKLMIEYQSHYIRQFADANGMMLDQSTDSEGNLVLTLNEA
jgi:hypothetical protein